MTSEAQPGQEQRMELKSCERCGGIDQTVNGCQLENSQSWSVMCACGHQSAFAASTEGAVAAWNTRPTADLGEDGELVESLRRWHGKMPAELKRDLAEAADRLILYREALEVLLLVKDAVDYRGDACHPAEMVGAVLDKCILERIDAVLSRSGG